MTEVVKSKLYLKGRLMPSGTQVACPLSSSCILFVVRYCQTNQFLPVFVDGDPRCDDEEFCCFFDLKNLATNLDVSFIPWKQAPAILRNVLLPSLHQPSMALVRSGLCVVLRHIINEAHATSPDLHLIDLLGFRRGSMKMCAEVSGWTKLCEVELAASISELIKQISSQGRGPEANCSDNVHKLPLNLFKLDGHFNNRCVVHNDDHKRRSAIDRLKKHLNRCGLNNIKRCNFSFKSNQTKSKYLSTLKNDTFPWMTSEKICSENKKEYQSTIQVESLVLDKTHLYIEHFVNLHHGIRKMKIDKIFHEEDVNSSNSNPVSTKNEKKENNCNSISKDSKKKKSDVRYRLEALELKNGEMSECVDDGKSLSEAVESLEYLDIEYVHVYSEGVEMTVADLILLDYIYHLAEALRFNCRPLACHIPNIVEWAGHMTSLPTVISAGELMGWEMIQFHECLQEIQSSSAVNISLFNEEISFIPETKSWVVLDEDEEEDMELSRCSKVKHRAIKPEVLQTLKKLESSNVCVITGSHPRGEHVHVDWESLPAGIHPKEGKVPEKRTLRKCQQLENLVTAVQSVAKRGDIIVDFCSGGGHLGIAIAYLLPDCQVYLVENKEESLLGACKRLETLNLSNVTLYQCNIDYFIGKFQIGVCLHACGSATDMVLQLCLNNRAAFVICPCCYGGIKKTHLLSYPRSDKFLNLNISYKDFMNLGHAADQTERNIALEEQGRHCMNLVDTDRAEYARQQGYHVTLTSLQPLTCSPKNNLLIGFRGPALDIYNQGR